METLGPCTLQSGPYPIVAFGPKLLNSANLKGLEVLFSAKIFIFRLELDFKMKFGITWKQKR